MRKKYMPAIYIMANKRNGTLCDMLSAIDGEKQIKGGSRKMKLSLIEKMNPDWKDLYEELL